MIKRVVGAMCALVAVSSAAGNVAPAWAEPVTYESEFARRLLEQARDGQGWRPVPDDVKIRLTDCMAKAMVEGFAPSEVEQLDNAARGGPDPDLAVQQQAEARIHYIMTSLTAKDVSPLKSICPSDIPSFVSVGFTVSEP